MEKGANTVGKEFYDLTKMSVRELEVLFTAIAAEQNRRVNSEEAETWRTAMEPLRAYCKKYPLFINIDGNEYHYGPLNDEEFDELFYSQGPGIIYEG